MRQRTITQSMLFKAVIFIFCMAMILCTVRTENVEAASGCYYYKGHKYQIIDKNVKWSAAKKACEAKGGHLVTITSAGEQKFLNKIMANGDNALYWIGLYKSGDKKKWVTGEKFKYQNIEAENEDQKFFGMYAADADLDGDLHITKGEWYDHDNTLRGDYWDYTNAGYICEWDEISVESVELNKSSATMHLNGKTLQLKASVAPEQASNAEVIWSSSNEKVAIVSKKGVVTAVGKGTAVITCQAADGSGKEATCKIKVKK